MQERSGAGVEYAAPVSAIECGIDLQKAVGAVNAGLSNAEQTELGIGIHAGTLVVDEGLLFGDAIHLAARLATQAPPGGVCISNDILDSLAGDLKINTVPMDESVFLQINQRGGWRLAGHRILWR